MENNYTVYMHKFPNMKVYIGITNRNVEARWRKKGSGYNNSPRMANAIQKYGWENIEHKIMFQNLTKEEAEQKEIELIAFYKSNQRKYGYNIANGGFHRGKTSYETKRKIKEKNIANGTLFQKGVPSWNKGMPMKEETKQKIASKKKNLKQSKETIEKRKKALIGHNVSQETINKIQKTKKEHYPNGFKHTDTTKEKLRQHNLGKKQSEETKRKRSNTMKEKYKNGYISPLKGKKPCNYGITKQNINNKNEYMVSDTILGI